MSSAAPSLRSVALGLLLSAYLAAVGALLCGPVSAQMTAIRDAIVPSVAATPVPPLLAYGLVPLAVLSSMWLLLSPGLLLTTAFLRSDTLGHWLLYGLALSLVVIGVTVETVEWAQGGPLTGSAFIGLVTALSTAAGAIALGRRPHVWTRRTTGSSWTAELSAAAVLVFVLLVSLVPKFFFESFNGDGAHAFEATRLLKHRAVAFFGEGAGDIASFPGMNSVLFTYPGSWFMRLFGETEAAVRLPFLLYLALLGPVVLAAASTGGRRPSLFDTWLVMASLAVFAIVMSYSATYDPYSADVALPATQDTLFLVLLLGVLIATLENRPVAVGAFSVLAVLCSQAAVAMTALWLGARWLADRRARGQVARHLLALAAAVVAVALLPILLALAGAPAPGAEHGVFDLLRKFVALQITDLRRVAFVFVPVGLYPALVLLRLRRRDPVVDALALFLAASFGLYYVMANYSLHYFVPAMVISLVLFWRSELAETVRSAWFGPAAVVMATVALLISLPIEPGIYTATRDVGKRIDVSAVSGYDTIQNEALAHADALGGLFPADWRPEVPDRAYGGSPLAWHVYAQQARHADGPKDYLLSPTPGGEWEARPLNAAAYARDRVAVPPGSRGARLYQVPRDLLFGREHADAGFRVLDIRPLVRRILAVFQQPQP